MRSRSLISLYGLSLLIAFSPAMGATFAALTARTGNPGALFAAMALYAPSSLQGNPAGRGVTLSWAAGQNGSGYKVLGFSNGTSATCPADTNPGYSPIGSTTALSYTDANRSPASVPQGTWYCYQVQTTYQSWNSVQNNPARGVQVGVVASGLRFVNVNSGKLDSGDYFIIDFNQAIDPTTAGASSNTVCANSNVNTVWIGSATTGGGCGTSESVAIGRMTGMTLDQSARWAAIYAWSNGNKTLTVTIGSRITGSRGPTISGTGWTFTPTTDASKLLSVAGRQHICDSNAGGGNCTPSTAGSARPSGAGQGTPTPSATSTSALPASPTATATGTPQPPLTATSTATIIETPTGTAIAIPTDTATSTVTAVKTITPAPRQTRQPTHTPSSTPTQVEISPTQIVPTPTRPLSNDIGR